MNENNSVVVNVRGYDVILDEEFAKDFDVKLWHINKMKRGKYFYVSTHLQRPMSGSIMLHRIVACANKGQVVDHINGNTLDCRRSNLRVCSVGENSRNRRPRHDCKSGLKGVYYRPPSKKKRMVNGVWVASIGATIDGKFKRIHLGHFKTSKEAALAYNEACSRYHGEFAKLNPV